MPDLRINALGEAIFLATAPVFYGVPKPKLDVPEPVDHFIYRLNFKGSTGSGTIIIGGCII
jgi:hypothetical protein